MSESGLVLSCIFLDCAGGTARWGPPGPEMEAALRALFERGRRRWGDLALSAEDLARCLARRLAEAEGGADLASCLSPLNAEDLFLASACELGRAEALAAFDQTLLSQVPLFLSRLRCPPADVSEVQQILRESLFVGDDPKIRRYAGTGKLASWVRTTAVRTALRLMEGRHERALPFQDIGEAMPQIAGGDLELDVIRGQHKEALEKALADAFQALSEQQRELLHLHHVGGLSTRRLATLFNTHQSTIVRWLQGASERVLAETKRLLAERHDLTPGALASLLVVMQSQLDLSIARLLKKKPAGGAP